MSWRKITAMTKRRIYGERAGEKQLPHGHGAFGCILPLGPDREWRALDQRTGEDHSLAHGSKKAGKRPDGSYQTSGVRHFLTVFEVSSAYASFRVPSLQACAILTSFLQIAEGPVTELIF